MADELKTIKFQMMLSEREAGLIDAWASENNVRSRAEAIRRLCSMALAVDPDFKHLMNMLSVAAEVAYGPTDSKTPKFKAMIADAAWTLLRKGEPEAFEVTRAFLESQREKEK